MHVIGDGRAGGGATCVLTLSRALLAQGHSVSVVTQRDSYLLETASEANIRAFGLDFSKRRDCIGTASDLRRCVNVTHPTIIHCHGARAGLPTAILGVRSGQSYVYTVHGFHFTHKRTPMRQLARAVEAFCISNASCTIFVSNGDFEFARQCHLLSESSERGRVIKNAVSVDRRLYAAEKRFDIGFLGRLDPVKNPLLLIDILKALRPLRASMCIIGGGELQQALKTALAAEKLMDQVTITGELRQEIALEFAAQCRVLVLPSLREGYPVAVIEAMHLGLPVVASDVPGNREAVIHGETGFLVPARSVGDYAQRIQYLLSNQSVINAMQAAAESRARSEYSVERNCAAHVAVYREVVGRDAWDSNRPNRLG